ncbi:MAG: hypothetical protein AAF236_16690 [Verrucomicrobiota bacterium]
MVLELSDEIAAAAPVRDERRLTHRMKKFTNYIGSGIAEGAFSASLRRAQSWTEFREICDRFLDTDGVFPDEPVEDGKLFCGFRELNAQQSSPSHV